MDCSSRIRSGELTSVQSSVQLQIYGHLDYTSLLTVRRVSRATRRVASSDNLWRNAFDNLVKEKLGLLEIELFPLSEWAFSELECGWYKAFCKLLQTANGDWLLGEESMKGTKWAVTFTQDGESGPHCFVKYKDDMEVIPYAGPISVHATRWWMEEGCVRGNYACFQFTSI